MSTKRLNSSSNITSQLKHSVLFAVVMICCINGSMQGCNGQTVSTSNVRIVKSYVHDAKAFTQGLIVDQGRLLEGTGRNGESELRLVELDTGKVLDRKILDRRVFGEGIAVANGELFQISWRNKIAFIYDAKTLEYKRRARYSGEGWGLTFDGKHLIMSDGSSVLRFYDPETFKLAKRVSVLQDRRRVSDLNELEFVEGEVWANIWHTDHIARIDPESGQVTGWIDISNLKPSTLRYNREAVANGIAYDAQTKKLYMTGKNWPVLYEVELISR